MGEHRTFNIEHRTPNRSERRGRTGDSGRKFDLEARRLEFASAVIDLSESLPSTRAGGHVGGQLLHSGTSPYANHGEAESAETPDDFIHKLKVCLRELRETRRWFRLMQRKEWSQDRKELQWALGEVEELIRIFVASVRTATRNRAQPRLMTSMLDVQC
jgi:four helix bundle protein